MTKLVAVLSSLRPLGRAARRRRPRCLVAAAIVGIAAGVAGPAALAQSAADLEERLGEASSIRSAAERRVTDLTAQLADLDLEIGDRFDRSESLAADIESAKSELRDAAVSAYIAEGANNSTLTILAEPNAETASRKRTYSEHRAGTWADAAARFDALKRDNDPELVALVERREDLAHRLEAAQNALMQSRAVESDAEWALAAAEERERVAAEQAAAKRAADQAAAERAEREAASATTAPARAASGTGSAPASSSNAAAPPTTAKPAPVVPSPDFSAPLPQVPEGGPSPEQWAALRQCESSGNYQAVSRSGKYRGAYQFDHATWAGLGGNGDPAAAPPVEQDARARLLYSQRGTRPWPHCGRHLVE